MANLERRCGGTSYGDDLSEDFQSTDPNVRIFLQNGKKEDADVCFVRDAALFSSNPWKEIPISQVDSVLALNESGANILRSLCDTYNSQFNLTLEKSSSIIDVTNLTGLRLKDALKNNEKAVHQIRLIVHGEIDEQTQIAAYYAHQGMANAAE